MADSPCGGCGKPMGYGDYTEALGKEFHVECFVCSVCKKDFPDNAYVELNGKPAHSACVKSTKTTSEVIEVCSGCNEALKGGENCFRLKEEGGKVLQFHDRCVMCSDCGKPIGNAKYGVSHGKPVHLGCMHGAEITKEGPDQFAEDDMCQRCNQRIQGQRKTVPGFGHFHLTCFRCCKCGLGIRTDQTFVKDNTSGQPVCKNCM
jgi:actin-binding LIM protein